MNNDRAKAIRSALLTAYNVGKAGGGDVNLPMDEASRMARADAAYPQNVFHGTHDVFNEFDPSMVDIGVHVGTARQAENRLKSLSNPFSSGRSNTVRTGANIMPLKTNFGKSLEMEDVGNWKDSEILSRALEKKGIKVDGLVDEASEVKSQYEDADNWLDSPENRRNLDDLNAALREKGYGSIKYKNLVENEYGETTQLLPAAEKQRALINSEISHIQGKAYERMPKPPENPNSPTADAEMRVFLNSKMENYLQSHEANRIDELRARSRAIFDDPKSYDDPNSYIILDTAKLRSRFAKFDPKRAHESDLGAATGGFIHDPEKAKRRALMIARGLRKAAGGDVEKLPAEAGTSPIPEDHVRLYHQTSEENIPSILKSGLTLSRARGIEGPKAIYADEQGFYGKPGDAPTVEFSVPKERWKPPFVMGDVNPSDIIAHHVPWHRQARYILNHPDILKEVMSGQHDDLTGDYKKAVDHIKRVHKASGGDVEPDDSNPRAVIGGNNPPPPVYYSALEQGVADAKQMQAPPQDWKAIASKLPGVKQEEIDYSGLHDFLDKQQGQVSKDDVLSHLKQNPAADLREVWKSGLTGPNKTKFGSWVLPGGANYKELVMALPEKPGYNENYKTSDAHSYKDDASNINRLAHVRMNDRVGPNGEKLLHIEELQSDWHQKGRDEGYQKEIYTPWNNKSRNRGPDFSTKAEADAHVAALPENIRDHVKIVTHKKGDVPDAPYKDTKDWTALAMKRVMRHAVDNDYDGITWTTGDQQADRYDLSKQVSSIKADQYNIADENGWRLNVKGKNGDSIPMPGHYLSDDELADHVGKDMAKKIIDSNGGEFHGLDLKVGGSGMRKYYDEIVPSVANKLGKEHGVKHSIIQYPESGKKYRIEQTGTQMGRPAYTAYDEDNNIIERSTIREDVEDGIKREKGMSGERLHYLPVKPSMKKSAKLFKSGGTVQPYKHTGVIGDAEKAKRYALTIARGLHKAEGGIASITSPDPEMREAAKKIAQTTYKVPTDTTFKGSSYFGVKPPMGASDVKATVDPIPGVTPLPKKLLSWDDFFKQAKGGTLVALGGDRSRLGRLTHINGKKLAWPVDLHAGVDYMREPNEGAVWANASGHSSRLNKIINEAGERGPVYGAFTPMGPKSVDSSFQMTDAVLSQIASDKPDKTSMKLFDEAIKNGFYVGGQREEDVADRLREKNRMKDWPGIKNTEEAKEFIKNNMPGAPRSLLMKYMDKAGWTKLGFPHIGVTRVAITDPDLLNVGGNMMGHRVVELTPNPVSNLSFEHNTYPEVTGGKYVGDVPLVQRHYGAPDVIDQFAANPKGKVRPIIMHPYSLDPGARSGAGKMFEVQKAQQPINERMINEIGKGLELQSEYGFADGGEVNNNELLNTADRLGVDKSNIPALSETKKMIEFHNRLGDEIQKRSQTNAEIVAKHRELGNLPLDVGTRFSTEHSRSNNLPPFLVTGYYVNSKNPDNHYGYYVSRNNNDGVDETVISVKNPMLEKQKTPEEWEAITKGFKPMMGPKSIKSTGGLVEGDVVRRALNLTRSVRS